MSESEQTTVEFSTDVGYFNSFLDALDTVRDEAKIFATDDQVYSKVIDPADVMMCVARIKGQALNSLNVENGEKATIGLNIEAVNDLLSGTSATSEMVFQYPHVKRSINMIRINVVDEDVIFDKPGINHETIAKPPQDNPLKHSTRIVVDGTKLKKAVGHVDKLTDSDEGSVIFGTKDDVFYIKTSDKVDGDVEKKFRQSGPSEDGSELGNHETEVAFSYVKAISKVFGGSDSVTVHIKDNNPIRFDIDLDDEGDAQIIYLIAPRVDD